MHLLDPWERIWLANNPLNKLSSNFLLPFFFGRISVSNYANYIGSEGRDCAAIFQVFITWNNQKHRASVAHDVSVDLQCDFHLLTDSCTQIARKIEWVRAELLEKSREREMTAQRKIDY